MPLVSTENQMIVSLLVDQYFDLRNLGASLIDIDVTTLKNDAELFGAMNKIIQERFMAISDVQPIDFQITSVCFANNH